MKAKEVGAILCKIRQNRAFLAPACFFDVEPLGVSENIFFGMIGIFVYFLVEKKKKIKKVLY
jgi:hypothetical protein